MSLLNFRDPARTADPRGDRISRGVLFRSAQPFPVAGPGTVALLRAEDVRTIVDLRGASERRPDDWTAAERAGITVVRAPLDATGAGAGPDPLALVTDADLGHFYLALARSAPRALADAVSAVARPGAVLVHCAAGKDRTGLLVALLLELLDVPEDGIVTDYARTADDLPRVLAALAGAAGAAPLNDRAPAVGGRTVPAPLLQAPPTAIRVFLDTVRTRHGGAGEFLRSHGVDAAALAAFRAKAAVPAGTAPGR
ncbi:tyrosine-protein phosphatase [Streptomyces sp. NPDC020965]|uniref:tyrosine-protein phosphatase n=1 Tax=Streptomyces sp. NPDC020965 TaxID=3365105 RepID=UPI00379907E3